MFTILLAEKTCTSHILSSEVMSVTYNNSACFCVRVLTFPYCVVIKCNILPLAVAQSTYVLVTDNY